MANDYTQFSEMIEDCTEEELAWASKALGYEVGDEGAPPPWWDDEGETHSFQAEVSMTAKTIWIYAEEHGSLDAVEVFVKEFLRRFRPKELFAITWADYCSKPRIGEFGGGAMVISATETELMYSHQFVRQARERLQKKLG